MMGQSQVVRRLDGKVALITGASRGIGAAAARLFAREGASVVLASRSEQDMQHIVEDIQTLGGKAVSFCVDVGDPASVQHLIEQIMSRFGRLDAAFNNAGDGHRPMPLAEVPVEDFETAVRVNLLGTFYSMKYEIPAMLAGGGGAIVNMSSTAGLVGVKGIGGYVASKHGIVGLTKTAALDYAAQNIRVNVVTPGPILTNRLEALPEEAREPVIRAVPMHRLGLPDEVAETAAWLCSGDSSFITGAVITIDGGRMAGSG